VVLYDASGAPMLMFGEKLVGNDRKVGFFSDPCAVTAAADNRLLVLDRACNGIHVFRPTTLTGKILSAVAQYNDGRYYDAEDDWQDILKANSSYYWANLGLGRIAYTRGDYPESMARMVLAENQEYYSDALWKLRAETTQKHAAAVILLLAGVWLHRNPLMIASVLGFVVGFVVLRQGIRAMDDAQRIRRCGGFWIPGAVLAVVELIAGVRLILSPLSMSRLVLSVGGVVLIVCGACSLVAHYKRIRYIPPSDGIIDADE
jgi:uncharacterized membrane protein HdeD (DUF308 family)